MVIALTGFKMNKNLEKNRQLSRSVSALVKWPDSRPKQKHICTSGCREEEFKTDLHWRPGGGREETGSLELDLAGGKRLILHDDGAAGGQDHDVELLLLLMCLLVPFTSHLCVVGGDQRHLRGGTRDQEMPRLI